MAHRAERRARLPDGVPVGLYRAAPTGALVDVNESLVEMLGYPTRQALLAVRARDLYYQPEEHERVQLLVAQRGVLHNHEARVRRHDGRPLWVELSLRALTDEHGRTVFEGAVADVTDRKLAEEALWESERRLRLFIDQVPAVLWAVDRDLAVTLSLGKGLEPLGVQPNELVGRTLGALYGDDDPGHPVVAAHRRCLHGESASYETEYGTRIFQSYVEPWREPDGTISGAIGVGLDVTEHQLAERALHRAVALRDAAFDALDVGLLLVDLDGVVISCNRAFTRFWGLTTANRTGTPVAALAAEMAPRLAEPGAFLARLCATGETAEGETDVLLQLHGGHTLRCRAKPLRVEGRVAGHVFTFRPHSQRARGAA